MFLRHNSRLPVSCCFNLGTPISEYICKHVRTCLLFIFSRTIFVSIKNFCRALQLEALWRLWLMGQPVCCILLIRLVWHLLHITLWNWQVMLRRGWLWERKGMRKWKRGFWSTICHIELQWFSRKFYGRQGTIKLTSLGTSPLNCKLIPKKKEEWFG